MAIYMKTEDGYKYIDDLVTKKMEVEITLSGTDFTSGTVTFNKTYTEIINAMEKGCFVIGCIKNQQFSSGVSSHYSSKYLRYAFPRWVGGINGETIFFIPTDSSTASVYITYDGTTGIILNN